MISCYDKKEECCGCSACKYICPFHAIEMVPDTEGFLYPVINQDICIDCNKCKQVCAFHNYINKSKNTALVYAVKHKSDSIRLNSTSGGAFTAFSDFFIDSNGIVYGVELDDNFYVKHSKATTKDIRNKFRGSKYVQSDLNTTFLEISKMVLDNLILFSGTPCQVDALLSYLKSKSLDNINLYTIDIICHGTPSPLMWKHHVLDLSKRSKILKYSFRSKVKGWHGHNELVEFSNYKSDYLSPRSQKHKYIFYANYALRPCCHNCKYTNFNRVSDITIADFWGIDKSNPDFDDNKGVSLVLLNSEKGNFVFNKIKDDLILVQSNTIDCLQPQLQHPTMPSTKRNEFWDDYYKHGYNYICRKYTNYNIKGYLKYYLKKIKIFNILYSIFKRYF